MQARIDANSKINASMLSKIPHAAEAPGDATQFQNILSDEDLLYTENERNEADEHGIKPMEANEITSLGQIDMNQTSVTEI